MKYLLIAVLLLPACGKDEDVKTHYNFESEQRKIELDFNRRQAEYQADYATHINRAISGTGCLSFYFSASVEF